MNQLMCTADELQVVDVNELKQNKHYLDKIVDIDQLFFIAVFYSSSMIIWWNGVPHL